MSSGRPRSTSSSRFLSEQGSSSDRLHNPNDSLLADGDAVPTSKAAVDFTSQEEDELQNMEEEERKVAKSVNRWSLQMKIWSFGRILFGLAMAGLAIYNIVTFDKIKRTKADLAYGLLPIVDVVLFLLVSVFGIVAGFSKRYIISKIYFIMLLIDVVLDLTIAVLYVRFRVVAYKDTIKGDNFFILAMLSILAISIGLVSCIFCSMKYTEALEKQQTIVKSKLQPNLDDSSYYIQTPQLTSM